MASSNDPFSLAVKAGLDKKNSLKDYLVKTEGHSEGEAAAVITALESTKLDSD